MLNKHDLERITSVVLYLEIDQIEMHGQSVVHTLGQLLKVEKLFEVIYNVLQ